MHRKDFLKHVAIGAVALLGGGVLLRLSASNSGHSGDGRPSTGGYGDITYGGVQPRSGGSTT
jgi:hypothetical protein